MVDLLCLPIPPPNVRPSVKQDNGQRMEDDLTHKICDIVKTNRSLKQKISAEHLNILKNGHNCYNITFLHLLIIKFWNSSAQRSGRP